MKQKAILLAGSALVLASVVLGWVAVPPALAQSAKQRQMESNRQKRDKLYDRITELNREERGLSEIVALIDERIQEKETEIATIQEQLDNATATYEQLTQDQAQLEAQLSNCKDRLADRARAIYMQGELTYADLLLQAASFGELVDRVFFVQAILARDEKLVLGTRSSQEELASKLTAVQVQINEIGGIREQLDLQLEELEGLRGQKELDIEAISSDKALALREIKELEEENKRIAQELRELANSASAYKGKPWSGSFKRPCPGEISSGFGSRIHPIYRVKRMHTGVDIRAAKGTPVKAAGEGKVVFTGRRSGYGLCVIIDHGADRATLYAHLSKIACDAGDIVGTSTVIGYVGSTGVSTGNHLHFEVRINGDPVDPLKEL